MDAPSTFFSLPHCHAVLHCRTRTDAAVASAISICLHSFIHPSFCIQEERLQHRLPGRRGAALLGEAAAAVRLAGAAAATATAKERVPRRSPEVTRRRQRPPEAAQDHPRGRRRIEVGRGEEFFPRLPDRVLIRLIKLISRFRLIDDDAAGERAAEVVHFPILRGLPPPEFPRERND